MKQKRQRMIVRATLLANNGTTIILFSSKLFPTACAYLIEKDSKWLIYRLYKTTRQICKNKGVDIYVEQRSLF